MNESNGETPELLAQLKTAFEADVNQWLIDSLTPDRGYEMPLDRLRPLILTLESRALTAEKERDALAQELTEARTVTTLSLEPILDVIAERDAARARFAAINGQINVMANAVNGQRWEAYWTAEDAVRNIIRGDYDHAIASNFEAFRAVSAERDALKREVEGLREAIDGAIHQVSAIANWDNSSGFQKVGDAPKSVLFSVLKDLKAALSKQPTETP